MMRRDSEFPQFAYLGKDGFKVDRLSEYHFRINGRLDIMPNLRGAIWAWFDVVTKNRGHVYMGELRRFVPKFFKKHPEVKAPAPITLEKGWWACPIAGCNFKMRDDGTAASARRSLEHLETH